MQHKQTIKLVACDLDGTLLDHESRITPANEAAIHRARAQGVAFILATGKTRASAVPVIEQLALASPGVFFQGHIICDANGRVLRERSLPRAITDAVFDYLETRDLPTIVYDREGLWATVPFPQRALLHDKYGEPMPWINPNPRDTPGINKFVLYSGGGDDEALRRELQERFGDRLSVFKSAPEFIEMISPSVSKGEAVAWLANQLGVDLRQVLAIGDGENDVEMLQLAGIGVAVDNAMPATKAAADVCVAANDQSGVAEALRRFVL